jgi:GDPmannose 4,6-dehydratase
MAKTALITGVTGQDGSYLAQFLVQQGYQVHGIIRRASSFNTGRLDQIYQDPHEEDPRLQLHYGDLHDTSTLSDILAKTEPDEIYNLGAQSHVRVSFDVPEYTGDTVGTGTLRLLEAFRRYVQTSGKRTRFYQAGSSEMFGAANPPQNELTPFHPRSPYAVAKVAAHWYCRNYRESYDFFICNGILFNHESPRRGETFVTRKITRAVGRIKLGLQDKLYLGNLDAKRDWGFAGDYVKAMWTMLQQDEPDDYVIATGASYSVRDFLAAAFGHVDLDWHQYVATDPRYFRPAEVDHLEGDATKANQQLGWTPETDFQALVRMMVDHDIELARQERTLVDAGHIPVVQHV